MSVCMLSLLVVFLVVRAAGGWPVGGVDVGSVPGKIGRGVILGSRCIAACGAEGEGWIRFSRGEGWDIFV